MVAPWHSARVKEVRKVTSLGVRCCDIATLETVALGAGVGKIVRIAGTAVLSSDNVINLVCEGGVIRMDETVFATVHRSCGDHYSRAGRNPCHGACQADRWLDAFALSKDSMRSMSM